MADSRYLEAWRRGQTPQPTPATSSSPSKGKGNGPSSAASYNIRLDVPGGYSFAPDQMSPHNMEKRLFLPNRDLSKDSSAYDYIAEIRAVREQRKKEREQAKAGAGSDPLQPGGGSGSSPFVLGVSEEEADLEDDLHIKGLVNSTKNLSVDPAKANGGGLSAAQRYAASIDMATLPSPALIELNRSLANLDGPSPSWMGLNSDARNPWGSRSAAGPQDDGGQDERASLLSNATHRSNMSKMTVTERMAHSMGQAGSKRGADYESTLLAAHKMGLNDPSLVATKAPGAISGDQKSSSQPWDAQSRTNHRALDRPTTEEKAKGIAAFDNVSGQGRAPTASEVGIKDDIASIFSTANDGQDGKSVAPSTATRRSIVAAAQLRPADLFTPDPRPYKPLRYVRRSDPRQVLLLCAGRVLDPQQAASLSAAKAAVESGMTYPPPQAQKELEAATKKLMTSYGGPALRGGIGVVFCPEEDPWLEQIVSDSASMRSGASAFQAVRKEPNCSRRLERPPEFSETSKKRAALRAACAALEYTQWEQEGFDKIVLACNERWLVQGISNDIWQWRAQGWTLTGESPLGAAGESVPDRDLWELLDYLVKSYEKIE